MSSSADEDSLFQALGTSCYERICQLAMDKDVEDRQMIHLSTHTCIEDVETHENLLRHLMKVSGKSMSKPALVCKCFERLDACNDYSLSSQQQVQPRRAWAKFEADKTRIVWA